MDEEILYYLAFSHFPGIGPHNFQMLLNKFKSAKCAYTASEKELNEVIGGSLSSRLRDFRKRVQLERLYSAIIGKNISVITRKNKEYPVSFLELTDPPICLYVKGKTSALYDRNHIFFAIVGTRNPTSYGAQLAKHFAYSLAENGCSIVSGLALGIDAIAHTGALDAKASTVAVLGCGVDIVYPPANKLLYERILNENGVIISEFPPGHTVAKGMFVARNRLISGLAQGVLVVEGTDRSGTLITAKYAADQGKTVFAPPGPITSQASGAPNLLLKQGAVLVTKIEDILEELGMRKKIKVGFNIDNLTEEEKRVVGKLQQENCTVDELVLFLHLPLDIVSLCVSQLEVKGIIVKDTFGRCGLRLV